MILTILSILLLIAGIFMLSNTERYVEDLFSFAGIVFVAIGAIFSFVFIFMLIDTATTREIDYQNKLYEKEVLEYRLEKSDDNTVGNEMLYNDIVEFNNSLRGTKKWANNPFTNWFWNRDIATIEYIEFRE